MALQLRGILWLSLDSLSRAIALSIKPTFNCDTICLMKSASLLCFIIFCPWLDALLLSNYYFFPSKKMMVGVSHSFVVKVGNRLCHHPGRRAKPNF